MKAHALVCEQGPRFSLRDVEIPQPEAGQLLIRTHFSGVSIGTEMSLAHGRISWGPFPICTGYQGVGQVIEVGANVGAFHVGQFVYFRDNRRLQDGRGAISACSGVHCSHAWVDVSVGGIAALPARIDLAAASFFVVAAVGLHGVDMAAPKVGEHVLVYGAGLIGLAVVAQASLRGCRVTVVDVSPSRLDVARKLGADHVVDLSSPDGKSQAQSCRDSPADTVFECTGRPDCITDAITMTRKHGRLVLQGNYGAAPIAFDFMAAHVRHLRIDLPCDDGGPACREAVLKQMASGALRWQETLTHQVPWRDSPALFNQIGSGAAHSILGATIDWRSN